MSERLRDWLVRSYPEYAFGGFTDADGTIRFYARVNALLSPNSVVLDVGCGRAAYMGDPVAFRRGLRVLRGKVHRVIGIDMDRNAQTNPCIDEFRLMTTGAWPLEDASVDLALADYVLEHVEDPAEFFSEAARVLRPGGYLCVRTTNRRSYVGFASALIPNGRHGQVVTRVQTVREERDVFPTLYHCNTPGRLRRAFAAHFEAVVYAVDSEPQYLSFSSLAFRLGVMHQRHAPKFLGPGLFGFGRRRP